MTTPTRRFFVTAAAALAATSFHVVMVAAQPAEAARLPAFGQGLMIGEVTATSVIVQTRVTSGTTLVDGEIFSDGDRLRDGDLPGASQTVLLSYQAESDDAARWAEPITVDAAHDCIARFVLTDLEPGTVYRCTAHIKATPPLDPPPMVTARFKTHPGKEASAPIRFVMSSCMNYDTFMGSDGSDASQGSTGDDRGLGYPAAAAVLEQKPDFVIFAGDVVYYDKQPRVKTLADMRAKWHRQYNLPRMRALTAAAPGYYLKDDHDFRDNDSDSEGSTFPPPDLGIKTFREQCPILAPGDDHSPTYRTHRVSKDLQIWMLEGRDHRSPNASPDGPDKTVWGREQEAWLKKTLLASDATYRIIISPTPLVGPDDGYKTDNHTNPKGFQAEGEAFKQWGTEHGLWANTFLMCGDRHWQYHSIDPTGLHEFSCGAFNDENSRMGRKPGDKKGTDPQALVTQRFTSPRPTGGFITVTSETTPKPRIRFDYYDDLGEKLYGYEPGR
jgi:alkaline phosphatase/alkaline phosphatase D